MKNLMVFNDGMAFTVYYDGKPVTVANPSEFKAFTLHVRDEDRRLYDSLMQSEEARRALDAPLHDDPVGFQVLENLITLLVSVFRR